MTKLAIINKASRTFYKVGFKIKKHSPEILAVGGAVGVVVGGVMACKATTKLSGIMDEHREQLDQIDGYVQMNGYSKEYTEEDKKKDMVIIHAQTGVKLSKLYAPAVIVGAVSLTALLASNGILRKRNVALSAAYATLDRGFKDYRGRVIERFGEGLDKELKYNIKVQEFETVTVDDKGKEKKVKEKVEIVDPNNFSPYAILYDTGNREWEDDPELNKFFLIQQQNHANDLLKAKGHLFLNEVYDMLGAPRTKAGQVVGWIYDEKNPIGDNFVDFGIFDVNREKVCDFLKGYEKSILLDFNVDGNILDLM